MDLVLLAVLAVVVIAVTTTLAERLGVAGPILLVLIGLAASLFPFVPPIEVPPDVILIGVLPPLLYASAMRIPAIEFRRDLASISGLAVLLVVVSALVMGAFYAWVIPGVDYPTGVALGAIVSPTDAVATGIARRAGIGARVATLLDGESLLNDAASLTMLRTAIATVAGGFAFWSTVGNFFQAIVMAIIVGAIVGWLTLRLNHWVRKPAAVVAITFTVPFAAYVPSEQLGGSGILASVVAGIVTGQGLVRWSTAEARLTGRVNWRTIELILEGAIFLVMGLELKDLVLQATKDNDDLILATWVAFASVGLLLVIRGGFVWQLLWWLDRRAGSDRRRRLTHARDRLTDIKEGTADQPKPVRKVARSLRDRVDDALDTIDYYRDSPVGGKEGVVIVWAGMRGVVTLAAAQTLPTNTEHRSLLILIAFGVALISLLVQGTTLGPLVRWLDVTGRGPARSRHEQDHLRKELRAAAETALHSGSLKDTDGRPFPADLLKEADHLFTSEVIQPETDFLDAHKFMRIRRALIDVMRERLVVIARAGTYRSATLQTALAQLDGDEVDLELRMSEDDD